MLLIVNQEATAVRLPRDNMRQPILLQFAQHVVQLDGEVDVAIAESRSRRLHSCDVVRTLNLLLEEHVVDLLTVAIHRTLIMFLILLEHETQRTLSNALLSGLLVAYFTERRMIVDHSVVAAHRLSLTMFVFENALFLPNKTTEFRNFMTRDGANRGASSVTHQLEFPVAVARLASTELKTPNLFREGPSRGGLT